MEAVEEGTNTEYQAVDHPLAFRLDHTVHLDALIETKNSILRKFMVISLYHYLCHMLLSISRANESLPDQSSHEEILADRQVEEVSLDDSVDHQMVVGQEPSDREVPELLLDLRLKKGVVCSLENMD